MKSNRLFALIIFLLVATSFGFGRETNGIVIEHGIKSLANRPADWAQPLSATGIRNFYEVSTNIYRGAQPTVEGMKELKAMGI